MEEQRKGKPRGRNGGRKSKPDGEKRQRLTCYVSPEVYRWLEERPEPAGKLIDRALVGIFGGEITDGEQGQNAINLLVEKHITGD